MTEIDALEAILADLAARGYDDAKLGVARNVLGRFARFLGDRRFSESNEADTEVFLEKVIASGASPKAVVVFRTVMTDAAPTIARFPRESAAPPLPEMAEPEMEALAEAPTRASESAPPEPPAPDGPISASDVFSEPPPFPSSPSMEPVPAASTSELPFPAPPPQAEPLPDFPMESPAPLPAAEPPVAAEELPAPVALPLPEAEELPAPLPLPIEETLEPQPAPPPESAPEPAPAAELPPPEAPLPGLPPLEAEEPPPLPPVSEPLLESLPESLLSPAPEPVASLVAGLSDAEPAFPLAAPLVPPELPLERPAEFAPVAEPPLSALDETMPAGLLLPTVDEAPETESAPESEAPLPALEELPGPPPLPSLESFGVPIVTPSSLAGPPPLPSLDLLGLSIQAPPAEAPLAPLGEPSTPLAAAGEPPLHEQRSTLMVNLVAAPEPAEPLPVEIPQELVARLTPRATAELPPVAAPELFEKSASDLLGTPPEEPPAAAAAEADPRETRRALVRDNLPAVLPTLLGQLEGKDVALREEARSLLREAGTAAAPALIDAAALGSPTLVAEIFALLQDVEGPEVPRLVYERLRSDLDDPLALVAAGGEPAIRLLLRHLPNTDEHEREWLGNWIEGNPEIAAAPLLEAMDSTDGDVHGYALRALGLLGRPEGIPGLIRGLEATDDDTRSSSAMALVRMGKAAVDDIGEVLLRSTDPDVQYEAAKTLGMIGHPAAVAYLGQALADEKAPHTSADALLKIGASSFSTLEEQLSSESSIVKAVAANALGRLGNPAAKSRVLHLLGDRDPLVQDEARNAAALLGATPEELAAPPPDGEADDAANTPASRTARIEMLRTKLAEGNPVGALAGADDLLRFRSQLTNEELSATLLIKARALEALGQTWDAVGALDQLLFADDSNDEARTLHAELSRKI